MKKFLFSISVLIMGIIANAQTQLDYFLPQNISYDKVIPSPKDITGHEVGEWHLTHDKLVNYLSGLAKISDRAIWEEYARSHENRPLGQLIISSAENIKNIEEIRKQHLLLCDPALSDMADIKNMPLFVKLGYGIHGNESSAQNSSVLTAYYLIAGQGPEIDNLLKNTIILIDPALNPDGMQRHSSWVNLTKSLNNNPDPNSWEFNEPWPGGRTNHYWFDLNRDYMMLQHPESVGRVAAFFKWRPNINTDHHEMGANETFFFQPGVQSRNNPLAATDNQDLTAEIAKYHEKYLNAIGSLYFSEESFDDFYLGKGSSYPDIHGSVGILFEQAGVKGHLRETPGGILSFPFAIRNQFAVSLSTLEAGLNMKDKLLESQRKFYKTAYLEADHQPIKAYLFTESADNERLNAFIKILLQHHFKIYELARDFNQNGIEYKAEKSYIIPMHQSEYWFIKSMFEPVKVFTDSTFYDVSTWVLPMSFNISYTGIDKEKELKELSGNEILQTPVATGKLIAPKEAYAYLFEWNEYLAPKALYELQNAGIRTRVSTKKFAFNDTNFIKAFSYGTILIPAEGQNVSGEKLTILLESVAKNSGITIYGVKTGLTSEGIDLGSGSFSVLNKPSVMMFVGDGTNSADAGEIWHMFDTRFNMPVTMVTPSDFDKVNLDRYNVLIVAGWPALTKEAIEDIIRWNKRGGTIIAYKGGNQWLSKNNITNIEFSPQFTSNKKSGIYIDRQADSHTQRIPGSIFETKLDLSHPLCYGYASDRLPVFKTGTSVALNDINIYNNPVCYIEMPLLSGYCSKENIERIKGTSFASVHERRIISIYDNTNFRAIWYGSNKIFMNAVFFGQIL